MRRDAGKQGPRGVTASGIQYEELEAAERDPLEQVIFDCAALRKLAR
jgi:hypothetical protein